MLSDPADSSESLLSSERLLAVDMKDYPRRCLGGSALAVRQSSEGDLESFSFFLCIVRMVFAEE